MANPAIAAAATSPSPRLCPSCRLGAELLLPVPPNELKEPVPVALPVAEEEVEVVVVFT